MRYKSAVALEMAVKATASASPMDTGRTVAAFYFHRLLCRVFANGNDSFVLKGGQAMLARTVDARATRDIDLLTTGGNLDDALEELVGLAEIDLGDFVTFEFAGSRPIKAADEYRSGLSVRLVPVIGAKRMQQFSIDLVVDEVFLEEAERVAPADRIEVEGLRTCDYLVYPVESALADKFCALIETHEGRGSSRVKDLVDITVYATTCAVNGKKLQRRVCREAAVRGIGLPAAFDVPEGWGASHARRFKRLCAQTRLPAGLSTIDAAGGLARRLFAPAVSGEAEGMRWNPSELRWEEE